MRTPSKHNKENENKQGQPIPRKKRARWEDGAAGADADDDGSAAEDDPVDGPNRKQIRVSEIGD